MAASFCLGLPRRAVDGPGPTLAVMGADSGEGADAFNWCCNASPPQAVGRWPHANVCIWLNARCRDQNMSAAPVARPTPMAIAITLRESGMYSPRMLPFGSG